MGLQSSRPTPPPTPVIHKISNLARTWLLGPGPVEDLEVVADPASPSITLRWRPPSNLHKNRGRGAGDVTDVDFLISVTEVGSSAIVDETRLRWDPQSNGSVTYTYTKSTLAPLKNYTFKIVVNNKTLGVRGRQRRVQQFFDWKCKLPDCSRSRKRLPHSSQSEIYEFCCKEHKHSFDDQYCLYPECTRTKCSASVKNGYEFNSLYSFAIFCSLVQRVLSEKISVYLFVSLLAYLYFGGSSVVQLAGILIQILLLVLFVGFCVCVLKDLLYHEYFGQTPKWRHFCSEHQAIVGSGTFGTGYFVHVKPSSQEFQRVKEKFDNTWCDEKGRRPTVCSVLAIVNPDVERAFKRYKNLLPLFYVCSEMYFHGTRLSCRVDEYQTPCSSGDCSVCSISKSGFRQVCIRRDGYQRFGHGFYLAPNSSKSRDYCSKSDYNMEYNAMLLCEVAPGNKYFLQRSLTALSGPPEGYHSVYGKSKFLFVGGDLNYDEVVVFKSEAICPRYVLLFR